MPRPLELLDLPTLYRARTEAISLDAARLLTRGNPLSAMGLMSYLNPVRHIYSAIAPHDGISLLGGIIHTHGEPFAHLLYFAPGDAPQHNGMSALLEHLAIEAGKWGAFHVIAEADESGPVYRALRESGFAVYAWQRMWDVSHLVPPPAAEGAWRRVTSTDLPGMQNLHHQIIPSLLHPVEPPPRRPHGMIFASPDMRGFVRFSYGLLGIVLTPYIHPESHQVPQRLAQLIHTLPDRRGRPVYLCVRSYQAWLEPVLEDLGAQPSQRQAVMVKHLAHLVKEGAPVRAAQPASVIPASRIHRVDVEQKK